MHNNYVIWHNHKVSRVDRERIKMQKACIFWFTGLPASGKSTLGHELEYVLNKRKYHTYVLDGDNVRHGLNSDLGFDRKDRRENIRRVGEVAKLFVDAGIIVIAAFISPFQEDRMFVRGLVERGEFVEIYTKCSLSVCKKRDPKGFYKKALSGEIKGFTGVDSPYEEPSNPEILLRTDKLSVEECIKKY
jgi:adenylyl-sulfate kinase